MQKLKFNIPGLSITVCLLLVAPLSFSAQQQDPVGILGNIITLDEIFMALLLNTVINAFWLGRIAGKQR